MHRSNGSHYCEVAVGRNMGIVSFSVSVCLSVRLSRTVSLLENKKKT